KHAVLRVPLGDNCALATVTFYRLHVREPLDLVDRERALEWTRVDQAPEIRRVRRLQLECGAIREHVGDAHIALERREHQLLFRQYLVADRHHAAFRCVIAHNTCLRQLTPSFSSTHSVWRHAAWSDTPSA